MLFILQQLAVAFQLGWALYLVSWLIFIQNLALYDFGYFVAGKKSKKIS
jgi:hypothetical protein